MSTYCLTIRACFDRVACETKIELTKLRLVPNDDLRKIFGNVEILVRVGFPFFFFYVITNKLEMTNSNAITQKRISMRHERFAHLL